MWSDRITCAGLGHCMCNVCQPPARRAQECTESIYNVPLPPQSSPPWRHAINARFADHKYLAPEMCFSQYELSRLQRRVSRSEGTRAHTHSYERARHTHKKNETTPRRKNFTDDNDQLLANFTGTRHGGGDGVGDGGSLCTTSSFYASFSSSS